LGALSPEVLRQSKPCTRHATAVFVAGRVTDGLDRATGRQRDRALERDDPSGSSRDVHDDAGPGRGPPSRRARRHDRVLYAGGITIRDNGHHLAATIGTELSADTISKVLDTVTEGGPGGRQLLPPPRRPGGPTTDTT
jgi:hypothetical protein